jgi:transposase
MVSDSIASPGLEAMVLAAFGVIALGLTCIGLSPDVGCYLRLRPRRSQHDPQLGITKAGNVYLQSLLIECANDILRPHGRDSSLRQWGLHLAARGGKQAKNKAVVAVARKLAVLLHHIWFTQELYVPFYTAAA